MKRSSVMLAGAATAALAAGVAASPAMAEPIPAAMSYADLLQPVPNAMERLAASDANQAAGRVELAQYYRNDDRGNYHHHHHHHHHNWRRNRAWYLNNGYSWYGNQWVRRPVYHHHHHHHDQDGY